MSLGACRDARPVERSPWWLGHAEDVREYIDRLHIDGHTIGEDHDDDPILIDTDGRAVDTWRENYPYDEQKYLLQVELLEFQTWPCTPRPSTCCCSRAVTPPASAARSSARVNAMRAFLPRFEYDGKDGDVVGRPDPLIVQRGKNAVGD